MFYSLRQTKKNTTQWWQFTPTEQLLNRITNLSDVLYDSCEALKAKLGKIPADHNLAADYNLKVIIPAMNAVRSTADSLEELTDKSYWPFPTYADILFYWS